MGIYVMNYANPKNEDWQLKQAADICQLPEDVVEILIRAKAFVPLYMPTQAHNKHNMLGLDIIKILEKYKIDWKAKYDELTNCSQ